MAVDWWDRRGAAPQWSTRRNPDRGSYGPEVCEVMRRLGFKPMPWQEHVLDVAFEHDGDGRMVYREVIEVVPRQAGKTAALLGVQVHRAVDMTKRLGRQRAIYTAQRHQDARDKLLEEHVPVISGSPYGRHMVAIRRNGSEGVSWANGSDLRVAAPTRKAGHGGSLDLVQIDEAFALETDDVEQGVKPTMITRRSPQMWVVSAAGNSRSTYLRDKVDVGREYARLGVDDGVAYFEWSADGLDVDFDDPKVWASVHPGVGFTADVHALKADHRSMKPEEFRRAYLAVWPTSVKPRIVGEEKWAACADAQSQCGDPVHFAVDVSPSRDMAAVSAAGRRADGCTHIEVVRHDHGTGWVVDEIQRLLGRHTGSTISVDTVGSAASLLPELDRRHVPVRLLTTSDVARSMGLLLDQITQGRLRHIDQLELNTALGSADKRQIGDKWAWARRDADITPLVSATLALWSLETIIEPKKYKMGLAM